MKHGSNSCQLDKPVATTPTRGEKSTPGKIRVSEWRIVGGGGGFVADKHICHSDIFRITDTTDFIPLQY